MRASARRSPFFYSDQISQLIAAFAPTLLILTLSRLSCAVVHGVFWSTIAPVAARLVPPDRAGRYIAPLVRRDGGLEGFGLSALLLGYGAAGLVGNAVVGRFVDRRPGPLLATLIGLTALALVMLIPAVYVVAFQIGIGGGALLGERFVSSSLLAWLPAVAAVFTVLAGLTVTGARRAFPARVPA